MEEVTFTSELLGIIAFIAIIYVSCLVCEAVEELYRNIKRRLKK